MALKQLATGGGALYWENVWQVDASTIDAADLTSGPATVNGVSMFLPSGRSPGTGGSIGFDGSTGLVFDTRNRFFYNGNTAPMAAFAIGSAVADWDPDAAEAICFQWIASSPSMANDDYLGGLICQDSAPADAETQTIIAGQYNGSPYWGLRDGTTTDPPASAPANSEQTFGEIVIFQGGVNLVRTGRRTTFADPLVWAPQAYGTFSPVGAGPQALDAATVWDAANAHLGLSATRQNASGAHVATFTDWRLLVARAS